MPFDLTAFEGLPGFGTSNSTTNSEFTLRNGMRITFAFPREMPFSERAAIFDRCVSYFAGYYRLDQNDNAQRETLGDTNTPEFKQALSEHILTCLPREIASWRRIEDARRGMQEEGRIPSYGGSLVLGRLGDCPPFDIKDPLKSISCYAFNITNYVAVNLLTVLFLIFGLYLLLSPGFRRSAVKVVKKASGVAGNLLPSSEDEGEEDVTVETDDDAAERREAFISEQREKFARRRKEG